MPIKIELYFFSSKSYVFCERISMKSSCYSHFDQNKVKLELQHHFPLKKTSGTNFISLPWRYLSSAFIG